MAQLSDHVAVFPSPNMTRTFTCKPRHASLSGSSGAMQRARQHEGQWGLQGLSGRRGEATLPLLLRKGQSSVTPELSPSGTDARALGFSDDFSFSCRVHGALPDTARAHGATGGDLDKRKPVPRSVFQFKIPWITNHGLGHVYVIYDKSLRGMWCHPGR